MATKRKWNKDTLIRRLKKQKKTKAAKKKKKTGCTFKILNSDIIWRL